MLLLPTEKTETESSLPCQSSGVLKAPLKTFTQDTHCLPAHHPLFSSLAQTRALLLFPFAVWICAIFAAYRCTLHLPAQRAAGDVLADKAIVVIPERLPSEAAGLRLIRHALVRAELSEACQPWHHHAVALAEQL